MSIFLPKSVSDLFCFFGGAKTVQNRVLAKNGCKKGPPRYKFPLLIVNLAKKKEFVYKVWEGFKLWRGFKLWIKISLTKLLVKKCLNPNLTVVMLVSKSEFLDVISFKVMSNVDSSLLSFDFWSLLTSSSLPVRVWCFPFRVSIDSLRGDKAFEGKDRTDSSSSFIPCRRIPQIW